MEKYCLTGPMFFPEDMAYDRALNGFWCRKSCVKKILNLLTAGEDVPPGRCGRSYVHGKNVLRVAVDIDVNMFANEINLKAYLSENNKAKVAKKIRTAPRGLFRFDRLGAKVNLSLWVKVRDVWP
jgi:hypothetical protein